MTDQMTSPQTSDWMDATERSEVVQDEAFKAANAVNDFIKTANSGEVSHAAFCELARTAGRIMAFLVEADEASEHFAETLLQSGPEAFGELALQAVGKWESTPRTEAKKFFLDVADVLGPDHVENFRVAGVFMTKADQF